MLAFLLPETYQQSGVYLQEGGSLPHRGKAVMDTELSQDMLAEFEEQQQ